MSSVIDKQVTKVPGHRLTAGDCVPTMQGRGRMGMSGVDGVRTVGANGQPDE